MRERSSGLRSWKWVVLAQVLIAGCGSKGSAQKESIEVTALAVGTTSSAVAPTDVTLTAAVAATGGDVAKVVFTSGDTVLGEVTAAPYQLVLKNQAAGTYAYTATATSGSGTTATRTASLTVTAGTLVFAEGGQFTLGDDAVARAAPAHPVAVSGFYVSKYELTFDEYDAFTTATGRTAVFGLSSSVYLALGFLSAGLVGRLVARKQPIAWAGGLTLVAVGVSYVWRSRDLLS